MTPPALDAASVHAKLRLMRVLLDDLDAVGVVTTERLAPSVGLRNILTHEYVEVDLAFVVRGIELARTDFRDYVHEVARLLES